MGRHRRTDRDRRRRSLGQNFLVDRRLIAQLIDDISIIEGELVVDIGAGSGALTVPLAERGARVLAVERDPVWAAKLATLAGQERGRSIRVIRADLRRLRLPREPYRVVANPPFNLTTELLGRLLDNPESALVRADLVLQREVVRKHTSEPPRTLRTAAWAPWWRFTSGRRIPADAFRPRPSVDAALLTIERRDPPILPTWIASDLPDLLRPAWQPPPKPR